MEGTKKTQTITTKIRPPFGDEFQLAVILPLVRPQKDDVNRVAFSIHLSKVGTNTPLGCYVYTIFDSRREKTHQTLLNNSQEILVDMAKRMGALISKKFHVPTYVSLSGEWSLDDLLATVQATVKFIEESF